VPSRTASRPAIVTPTLPSFTRTETSTAAQTETQTQTQTETQTETRTQIVSPTERTVTISGSVEVSPVAAASSSSPVWPWILIGLVLVVVIGALVARSRSSRRDATRDIRRRALAAYGKGIAIHDQLAVLLSDERADVPARVGDALGRIDVLTAELEALAPGLRPEQGGAELGQVRLSLGDLRTSLQAQAGSLDPAVLRQRLDDLETRLQAFRDRLSTTGP
jgi:hypothetical protein